MCHDTQANVSGGFVKDSLKIHIYVNVSGVATGGRAGGYPNALRVSPAPALGAPNSRCLRIAAGE